MATATTRQRLGGRLAAVGSPTLCAHHVTGGRYTIRPHLAAIDRAVRRAIATGGRLAISAPPRHGKSETVSRFLPFWYLGTYPQRRLMLASYEATFAATWGGKARDLMDEHGPALWGLRTRGDQRARGAWDLEGHEGGMVTAGVGGPFTGKGAHLAIIDDPIKNAAEAMSKVKREAAWEWYQSTLATRIEPGGAVIVMMTRWHRDDLIGRLLTRSEDEWVELRIPALAEPGDPLGRGMIPCPMCEGTGQLTDGPVRSDDTGTPIIDSCRGCAGSGQVGEALWPSRFDAAYFLRRMIEAPHWFAAQYQGTPRPVGGGMFRPEHRRRYTLGPGHVVLDTGEVIPMRQLTIFATMDVAASERTSADWTVIAVWGWDRLRGNLLLLDVHRRQQATTGHRAMVERVAAKWAPVVIGIERQTYGLALLQDLRTSALPVRPLHADADKVTRALSAAALYDNLQVHHPHTHAAPWVADYEAELDDFPHGSHDDQVDTAGYAALLARQLAHHATPDVDGMAMAQPDPDDAEPGPARSGTHARRRRERRGTIAL